MLIEIWDYFMRRKKLLLLALVGIALGCYGIAQVLPTSTSHNEVTYIHIDDWGMPETHQTPSEVAIPKTGETTPAALAVLAPQDVVALAPRPTVEVDDFSTIIDGNAPSESSQYASETTSTVRRSTFSTVVGNIALGILGLGVLVLGGYLTYQHFMR